MIAETRSSKEEMCTILLSNEHIELEQDEWSALVATVAEEVKVRETPRIVFACYSNDQELIDLDPSSAI